MVNGILIIIGDLTFLSLLCLKVITKLKVLLRLRFVFGLINIISLESHVLWSWLFLVDKDLSQVVITIAVGSGVMSKWILEQMQALWIISIVYKYI